MARRPVTTRVISAARHNAKKAQVARIRLRTPRVRQRTRQSQRTLQGRRVSGQRIF